MSKHAGSYTDNHFYSTFQSTPSRGKCICLTFSFPVADRGRLEEWCTGIGVKAVKSGGPNHPKTEASVPRPRLYAVILSEMSVLGRFCTLS